jgi:hypothetical protein
MERNVGFIQINEGVLSQPVVLDPYSEISDRDLHAETHGYVRLVTVREMGRDLRLCWVLAVHGVGGVEEV